MYKGRVVLERRNENLRGIECAEIAAKVLDVPQVLSIRDSLYIPTQLEDETRTGQSGGRD